MTKYPHLLKPLQLRGGMTLRNRVLMGSMHTGLEDKAGGFEKQAAFFKERAAGGVGLIVTGGISPNYTGKVYPLAAKLSSSSEAEQHKVIPTAVHEAGGKIALQILHAGRYAYAPWNVAPSSVQAPISKFKPWALRRRGVRKVINQYVHCAVLAQQAGYDGVEIMGSEGYLINEFLSKGTNQRTDDWGGSYANRMRFPLEIVRETRKAVGDEFIIIFRISLLDLVKDGSTWEETVELAKELENAGVTILNTGIGWHEARIPTIGTMVPRGGYAWVTERMKKEVDVPLVAVNRINTPEVAEEILASGMSDMVSLARPLLADADFVVKAEKDESHLINTCIGCNQACLDHAFSGARATCLVNPRACYEMEMDLRPTTEPKRVMVVGAGPAGMACATTLAQRGHQVELVDRDSQIGGQFLMAKEIPGKEEFNETLRYFKNMIDKHGVKLRLGTTANKALVEESKPDIVVIATGVQDRKLSIPGGDDPRVLSYIDVLKHKKPVGETVAVVGAGGIGFDVSEYLTEDRSLTDRPSQNVDAFLKDWGVDRSYANRGGLASEPPVHTTPRTIHLLQRRSSKHGKGLGPTTGWIHRLQLRHRKVNMIGSVKYVKFDDEGLHITTEGKPQVLKVDNVVVCAGQEPLRELQEELEGLAEIHVIGGAMKAMELDAKKAISDGTWLAAKI